jgi:hypothetical protein
MNMHLCRNLNYNENLQNRKSLSASIEIHRSEILRASIKVLGVLK